MLYCRLISQRAPTIIRGFEPDPAAFNGDAAGLSSAWTLEAPQDHRFGFVAVAASPRLPIRR
jgi:hypothetical protein